MTPTCCPVAREDRASASVVTLNLCGRRRMIGGALLDHRVGNAAETEEDQIVPIGFRFRFAGPVVAINPRRDNISKRRVGRWVGQRGGFGGVCRAVFAARPLLDACIQKVSIKGEKTTSRCVVQSSQRRPSGRVTPKAKNFPSGSTGGSQKPFPSVQGRCDTLVATSDVGPSTRRTGYLILVSFPN